MYWTIEDERPVWEMPSNPALPSNLREFVLPSDSELRPDMTPLKNKNFDEAEKKKVLIEELQRRDKKNRHAREKERGPK